MLLVQTSDPNPLPLSWPHALQLISMARDVLDTELTALVGESYNRAYGAMVQVQLLSELEEVIEYKMHPERRDMIRRAWWDRLQVSGGEGRNGCGGLNCLTFRLASCASPHLGAAIICETSIRYWVSSTHLSTGESVLVGKGVCLI